MKFQGQEVKGQGHKVNIVYAANTAAYTGAIIYSICLHSFLQKREDVCLSVIQAGCVTKRNENLL